MKNFNRDWHPERKPDELFFTNAQIGGSRYNDLPFTTKRKGKTAYDAAGNLLSTHYFPIFVKASELLTKNFNLFQGLYPLYT